MINSLDHFETFMQRIVALGIAANHLARVYPQKFKNSKEAAKQADEMLKSLRNLPQWKKWILNWLIE